MFTSPPHRTESIQNLTSHFADLQKNLSQKNRVSLLPSTRSFFKTLNPKHKATHKGYRGEGLVSMLLYMVIVAVIIIGIIALFFTVRDSYRENIATIMLNNLVGSVSKVYGTNRNYGSDTNLITVLEGFGALPDDARVDDGTTVTLEHPFGGPITIVGGPSGVTNRYAIAFTELDDDICSTMAGKYSTQSRGRSGIDTLDVNGTVLTRPIAPPAINAACTSGDGANTITWTFY